MLRGFGGTAAVCVAAACALPAAAGAQTKTVYAGPPPSAPAVAKQVLGKKFITKYKPDANAFFVKTVTVAAGDTVSFNLEGFHNIDIPAAGRGDQPLLLPGPTVTGIKDAAGNPFWFNGKVPSIGVNPAVALPSGPATYDGSTRIVSGLPLGPPKPLNVTFAKPGTYKYYCDVHAGMVGTVVVKPAGSPVPSAAQDAAAATAQLTSDLKAAKKLADSKVKADRVSIGEANTDGVELFAMFPARLKVKRGTVVTFGMSKDSFETHTASFGPKPYLKKLAKEFTSPVFPPEGAYPSSPKQPIRLSHKSHGNGFGGTGALDRDSDTPQVPTSGQIKFTKPGVYHYVCLIHPFMRGTVLVTK